VVFDNAGYDPAFVLVSIHEFLAAVQVCLDGKSFTALPE
jgi:hypothetical protein